MKRYTISEGGVKLDRSIKDIAENIGVSKTAVMKKIEKLGLRSSLQKINNQFALNEELAKLIESAFNTNEPQTETTTKDQPFRELVSVLQKELDAKNEQIADLHKLLDQQQQLQAIGQQKQNLLEQREQERNEQEQRMKEWEDKWKQAEKEVEESQEYKDLCKATNNIYNQLEEELEKERERVERLRNRGLIDRIINREV